MKEKVILSFSMKKLIYNLLFLFFVYSTSYADELKVIEKHYEFSDKKRERIVPVKVYRLPKAKAQPVILFSHGLGGSRENNAFLGNYWAKEGYFCVFIQHAGSDEKVWKNAPARKKYKALKEATMAGVAILRFQDIPFIIDTLNELNQLENHAFHNILDLENLGLCGHSYGAVTTIALAGQKFPLSQNFEDKRIKAFFAMSPSTGKEMTAKRSLGHIQKPVLCMTGTKDGSPIDLKMKPSKRREVYNALPKKDKYQLVLYNAKHHAFGDHNTVWARSRDKDHHGIMQVISLKFWNAYLKEDNKAKEWLQSKTPFKETKLKDKDLWEWK